LLAIFYNLVLAIIFIPRTPGSDTEHASHNAVSTATVQTVSVGPWTIGTSFKAEKFDSCTMSRSANDLDITFARSHDGLLLLLDSSKCSGQATTLMFALSHVPLTCIYSGDYAAANAQAEEVVALADEKGALLWKAQGGLHKGFVSALTGSAANAIEMITCGIGASKWTGSTLWMPLNLSYLALAHAQLDHFEDAWRCIGDATNAAATTKSKWCQAETYRIAGEIALMLPAPDGAKAEDYFERALEVAREQQAKSWELRAATGMARLWRDRGKPQQAHDLLAPIYGWFTEGFDTLDLKRAKAFLDELRECVSAI
jgi:predicted ATPase